MKGYLKMDVKRAVLSMRWIWAVIGVCAVLQLSLPETRGNADVLYLFQIAFSSELLTLNFVFGTFTYATSICEDFERKYIRLEIHRGDIWHYVISKTLICFAASVVTTALGVMLFIILNHFRYPFKGPFLTTQNTFELLANYGGFGNLLQQGRFYAYFLLSGIQFGLLSGALSVCAMFFSLFFKNKIMIYALPSIIYYLSINYAAVLFDPPRSLSIYVIFNTTYDNVWNNDILSFVWAICAAFVITICAMSGIIWGIRRRLEHE